MIPESFPGRGQDGEEPSSSAPRPAGGGEPEEAGRFPGDDPEGPGQGLFVCLPAEELSLAGFAQDGRADTMAPGPLLATVLEAVAGDGSGAGLAGLSDDQLMGVLSGTRRLEARVAWMQLAALAELARRRPPGADPGDMSRCGVSDFAADEVAAEFRLSWASAAGQIGYAAAVAARLPRCFAALAAGRIHPVHLRIIEDETRILSAADAARADEMLAEAAAAKTFGELRSAAHRLVLKLDPESARRRKEAARQDAHVRRFREDSGNAGMVARELPPDEVLASWQHIEQRALDLRAAGVPGTVQELRVRAYLDLLQERDSRTPAGNPNAGATVQAGDDGGADNPGGTGGPGGAQDQDNGASKGGGSGGSGGSCGPGSGPQRGPAWAGGSGESGGPGSGPRGGPAGNGTVRPAPPGTRDAGPGVAALVNLTVPFETVLGRSVTPAEVAGFGLLDAGDARDLVTAAARHPDTRWCVTVLHPDGTAAAHGCAPGRPPPGLFNLAPDGGGPSGPGPPDSSAKDYLRGLRIRLAPVARGRCDHGHAEAGYRPSRKLQHLVRARNRRCTAPGCGRPAARCDLDHTVAWDQGGLTCECDLSPLCRHHHRCKQAEGWQLEQPEPGVLRWRTPSGRTYATTPTEYPI
jgi:hypothetical protein